MVFAESSHELVKENRVMPPPLSRWWLLAALGGGALLLLLAARIDAALPAPLGPNAPPELFRALTAHRHLVNLTSIGPRVAGSYENEVLAVSMLVAAIKHIAAHASPHNRVELDLQVVSGAFPLAFMDGMNNVYRGVQNVVARVRGAGARSRDRSALLLNCHFDTVPDSPGASDDGAGCAVLLETLRALAASRLPLRHDAVFLFNGAEENILQASHGFITQHKWAKDVRAFINIEACGAGGREVLFQAGPHDPWIMEVYAGAVPHPFASSLAQELFESGLIPADTDFRIFRDFGKLSGVDLAWSANGYVYHTRLDTAARVAPSVLQRTGDNVLALARGLLRSERLHAPPDAERQPVFFDVLGRAVLCARAPAAAAAAAATLLLVLAKLQLSARRAAAALLLRRAAWWALVARAAAQSALALGVGVLSALAPALLLHAAGARLAWYSRASLLAPLFALPALAGTWWAARRGAAPALLRGWWGARAWHDASCAGWALLLLLCVLRGLRSGFLPLLCALLAAAADLLADALGAEGGRRAACWAAGALLPAAQMWYLALNSLQMFVPIMGRAGSGPLPADVKMAVIVATLVLASCGWMLPLLQAARPPGALVRGAWLLTAAVVLLVLASPLGAPYSEQRPQRYMVFHTRRTVHAELAGPDSKDQVTNFYWIPELDANTPHSVDRHVPALAGARAVSGAACAALVYCGVPYYLPVLSLISRSHWAPAPAAPLARLNASLSVARLNASAHELQLTLAGGAHVVLVLAPAPGARLAGSSALAAPRAGAAWGARRTYFFALHSARAGAGAWRVRLQLAHAAGARPAHLADVSLAAHALAGAHKLHPLHARLLADFPAWVAATGWGVDLHLYRV